MNDASITQLQPYTLKKTTTLRVCVVCGGLRGWGEEGFSTHASTSPHALPLESSMYGLVPSIVRDGEVINFYVRSWADWTSL